jgi:hypothetical protein
MVFIDDIIVFGETTSEHDENLKRVLERLDKYGLKVNKSKFIHRQEEVEYLGHIISKEGIKPRYNGKYSIENYLRPKNLKEVQKFIGLVNYYRRFIRSCANLIEPISSLLKKGKKFEWGTEQEEAFNKARQELLNSKVLRLPDFAKKFILYTDASDIALGAILSQLDDFGNEYVVAYASRVLRPEEKKYSISEKECLGIIYGLEHFNYYLMCKSFDLVTDHKVLIFLNEKESRNARISRWYDKISEYDINIVYKKGSELQNVDALSRIEIKEKKELTELELVEKAHEEVGHKGLYATKQRIKEIKGRMVSDKKIKDYIKKCMKCVEQNDKRSRGYVFVETSEPLEKVGMDICGPIMGKYILCIIRLLLKVSKVLCNEE